MLELIVFGSSSKGNSYLLGDDKSCLIIEAGVPFRKKILPVIGFKVSKVVGVIISHEHLDHAKYVSEYLSYSVPCYSSFDTIRNLGLSKERNFHPVDADKSFKVSGFTVIPFNVMHDVKCFGYLIHHKETGWILFATDTYYIKKKYKGLSHILVEANYSKSILKENVDNGVVPGFVKRRIMQSHMSIQTVQEMLSVNDLSRVNNIILLHLSDNNADGECFKEKIIKQTGIPTHIATPGLKLDIYNG